MDSRELMRDLLSVKLQLEHERRRREQAEERYSTLQHSYTFWTNLKKEPKVPRRAPDDNQEQDSGPLQARIELGQHVISTLLEEIRLLKRDLDAALFHRLENTDTERRQTKESKT